MKHLTVLFTFSLLLFTSSAAVPQKWDVELSAQPPQVFTLQRPRGETYELEAVLKSHGKPFAPAIETAFIYWQTNGMENLYWSAPASVSNNVLRATWQPSMDPGATTVRGYIGDPGHIYAAAFQFRFIASPGATPNELPLPQKVIDFAKVTVLNPPWGEIDLKRDLTNNVCAANSFGEWKWSSSGQDLPEDFPTWAQPEIVEGGEWVFHVTTNNVSFNSEGSAEGVGENVRRLLFDSISRFDGFNTYYFPAIATRIKTSTQGEPFVTTSFVTNETAKASGNFRTLNDLNIYAAGGMSDFEWSGDRQDALDAIGTRQPSVDYEDESEVDYSIGFELDGRWYYGNAYGRPEDLVFEFWFWADEWDEESGEWYYDELQLTATRHQTGIDKEHPVDEVARQSDMVSVSSGLTELRAAVLNSEVKVDRTGEPWQFGTGWGYLDRSVTSDIRSWRFRVPAVSVSGMSGSIRIEYKNNVTNDSGQVGYKYVIENPLVGLSDRNFKILRKVVRTEGKRGNDSVQLVDYRIGLIAKDASNLEGEYYLYLDMKNLSRSPLVYEVIPDPCGHDVGPDGKFTVSVDLPFVYEGEYHGRDDTNAVLRLTTAHYFDAVRMSAIPIVCTNVVNLSVEDVGEWGRQGAGGASWSQREKGPISLEHPITIGFNMSYDEDARVKIDKVVTSRTPHLFYDEGSRCTFGLFVTNGCFYSTIVTNADWRTL